MFRKIIGWLILFGLLSLPALAEDDPWPQPYTGEMAGTWGFNGGAEEHGDGFRLNPDGTGVCLEIIDYEQVPLQYRELEYTFTWRVERTADKTYLHETYADGRQVTYEIETWGGTRIHIPNHISGGCYYPVLDEEARAYLSGKAEHSAFDGLMMDYLDGTITGKIEAATGLQVGEVFLQKEQGVWQIVFGVWDDAGGLGRFLLREDEWRVSASDAGWLWGDFDLGQPWPAARTTEEAYARLPGILESYLTWEYAPVPTEEPAAPVIPELNSQIGTFPKNQRYEVYEGPRQEHRRAGSGKAVVSTNGEILVYGTWMGRMMIEYEIADGHHRIGWIDTEQLPASMLEGVPELPHSRNPEENVYGVVTGFTFLSDDPLNSRFAICPLSPGTSVRVLAQHGNWYLVEGFVDKDLRMGFVPGTSLGIDRGFVRYTRYDVDQSTRYSSRDIHAAFEAVALCIEEDWPGTTLLALRYVEAESADPTAWWQDETGQKEGILLFADLNSMELWDYEIAGYGVAKDYLFILYREPGGEWYVANWGYT